MPGPLFFLTCAILCLIVKKKIGIWLLALVVFLPACHKDGPGGETAAVKDLTVLFTPGSSFSGAGYDDAILKAVMESVAGDIPFKYHLLRPDNANQARSLALEWQESAGENSALLLCGSQYGNLAASLSPDKGRVLLLESPDALENGVSTLQLKRYGGAYLAGALCGGFPKIYIIKALDGDRMMDTVADGIKAGFEDTTNIDALKLVLSDSYKGVNMPDELFTYLYTQAAGETELDRSAMLAPVCGASRMGAYMFSNNCYYFSFGVGEDCSPFSDILPFSLVYDLGSIVKDYIGQWLEGKPWPVHQDFGQSTGHVYIQYNPRHFELNHKQLILWLEDCPYMFSQEQYMEWEARYKPAALEQEASHAY